MGLMSNPTRTAGDVPTLDSEELRVKLARGNSTKLVMAGSSWAFRTKHLPGSLYFKTAEQMFEALQPDDEIVVYCSNLDCHASLSTIQKLLDHGYGKVSHYAGGIIAWEDAGLPLEGEWGHGQNAKQP
jgi:rhodanese-related sulfurtransferase